MKAMELGYTIIKNILAISRCQKSYSLDSFYYNVQNFPMFPGISHLFEERMNKNRIATIKESPSDI